MKTTLNALHHQGNDWNRDLDFYVDELAILTKRIELVNSKKTDAKTAAQAAKFLKKFVKLREKTDSLRAALKVREKKVESVVKDRPNHINDPLKTISDKLFIRHKELAGAVVSARYEFNQFVVKSLSK
jgi:hypothetical protein